MEKSAQKYFAMVRLNPRKAGPLYKMIMEWNETPMEGVKLVAAYQVFGKWDFAFFFEADTNENALHFVGDKIRPVEGVIRTTTIPMAPIKTY
jgi:uncharacterized protein with GYD domain